MGYILTESFKFLALFFSKKNIFFIKNKMSHYFGLESLENC